MLIWRSREISLNKLKQIIRCCSYRSNPPDQLINNHIKLAAYQPKFIEANKDVSSSSQPDSSPTDKNFSMIFPPPNVTGKIHLGHALTVTVQDALVRWKQKQNHRTCWVPGTDHAGIATQVVVEKTLFRRTGKTRHDIGREEFLNEVWKWKQEKGDSITNDMKKLGTSFNWDKEYFTMDPNLSNAVTEAFIRLFDRGLIYRDESLINWSCSLESAISDVEVENFEIQGKTEVVVPGYDKNITFGLITDIAYKVVDSDQEVVVSTTRPETLLGDVAVAVHPHDTRYSHLKDAQLWHPFRNETIPLIFDESVDPEFGTGAVKITPAHDKNDFEVGKRHKLRQIQVITEKGKISDDFEMFAGLPRFHAREKILNTLAELQLHRGSKPHNMVLPICSRSKDVIEFLLRSQWFVNCQEMSKKAMQVVETGELKIHPKSFEKEWNRWLSNCRDWCVSRQLVWGHQIPAYRIGEHWVAAKSQEDAERKFKEKHPDLDVKMIERDPDVLDTWFSSGLLPFSVFGWPGEIDKNFFPLNLLETGHDILFFWVARMVMLSLELTDQIPFREILLHGIICDSYGRKMSKSLGNVISPDQIIHGSTLGELQRETEASVAKGILSESELEKSLDGQRKMFAFGIKESGIDALRFTLCTHNIKQHFISFDATECVTNRNFFNKIFHATKFANGIAEDQKIVVKEIKDLEKLELAPMDQWLLSRLGHAVKSFTYAMDSYNFHLATAALKTFFYDDLCNVYIEAAKSIRMRKNRETDVSCRVLHVCLAVGLDHLEVFAPFLALELKNHLPSNIKINAESLINEEVEKKVGNLLEICENIREMKSECRITKKIASEIHLLIKSPKNEEFLRRHVDQIKALTFSDDLTMTTNAEEFESEDFLALSTAGHLCSFGIKTLSQSSPKVENLLNKKKFSKMEQELLNLMNVVTAKGYQEKANEKVKKKHQEKIEKLKMEIESMRQIC